MTCNKMYDSICPVNHRGAYFPNSNLSRSHAILNALLYDRRPNPPPFYMCVCSGGITGIPGGSGSFSRNYPSKYRPVPFSLRPRVYDYKRRREGTRYAEARSCIFVFGLICLTVCKHQNRTVKIDTGHTERTGNGYVRQVKPTIHIPYLSVYTNTPISVTKYAPTLSVYQQLYESPKANV